MTKDLADFKEFVESNLSENGELPAFVGEWAESFINEGNVEDIIKILGNSKGQASDRFWALINKAPLTEEDWGRVMYIGSGVSQDKEHQDKIRNKRRKVVEIVRSTKYYQKNMNELFWRKDT